MIHGAIQQLLLQQAAAETATAAADLIAGWQQVTPEIERVLKGLTYIAERGRLAPAIEDVLGPTG